jgi:FPC/CPF motif-containing protein YcgG
VSNIWGEADCYDCLTSVVSTLDQQIEGLVGGDLGVRREITLVALVRQLVKYRGSQETEGRQSSFVVLESQVERDVEFPVSIGGSFVRKVVGSGDKV